ncbi:hypothetical protein PV367_25560 [Streptomyces europaeiscabiei]|uniref:Uncharacterized protein n=1 Tax=Streptomyces europaeiscabiei TaxID=146819 RepID=A0AAJ2UNE3_9ACTN|nr:MULTISPECIES: hypothetical protein [Streptomyces]MDX3133065.1 hypothetical protein [Streptomyces europaeiscabiei]
MRKEYGGTTALDGVSLEIGAALPLAAHRTPSALDEPVDRPTSAAETPPGDWTPACGRR